MVLSGVVPSGGRLDAATAPERPQTVARAAGPGGRGMAYSTRPMKFLRWSQSGSVVALHGGAPKPAGTLGYE